MNILIAEDDFTSLTALEGVLKKAGHEVTTTANGVEAWQALQQPDAPPLAILDWMMPGMDGQEVVCRVRAAQKTGHPIYIIMLTTKDEKADIVAGLKAGANDYLTKPFDFGELCARVEVGRRMVEMQNQLAAQLLKLEDALAKVKTLRGLIPICSACKKIRNDQGYWTQVETYLHQHTEAEFSHSICFDCLRKLYPEISGKVEERFASHPPSTTISEKAVGS